LSASAATGWQVAEKSPTELKTENLKVESGDAGLVSSFQF
jgi:hypothetical protein